MLDLFYLRENKVYRSLDEVIKFGATSGVAPAGATPDVAPMRAIVGLKQAPAEENQGG